jgi:predicted site-specific integrase-resolvase
MKPLRYKLTDAAKLLGISPWTLRRMVYAGTAPHIKEASGRIYIPAAWIEAKSQPQPERNMS